jgi:MoxR-like ATPase
VGFPTAERELEIVRVRAPGVALALAEAAVAAVHRLREMDLAKPPGVAETIDWVQTLEVVGAGSLEPDLVADTLGAVVKDRDDLEQVRDDLGWVASGA